MKVIIVLLLLLKLFSLVTAQCRSVYNILDHGAIADIRTDNSLVLLFLFFSSFIYLLFFSLIISLLMLISSSSNFGVLFIMVLFSSFFVFKAFMNAFQAACSSHYTNCTQIIHVPANKTFLLNPIFFKGPCNSASLHVEVFIHLPKTYSFKSILCFHL